MSKNKLNHIDRINYKSLCAAAGISYEKIEIELFTELTLADRLKGITLKKKKEALLKELELKVCRLEIEMLKAGSIVEISHKVETLLEKKWWQFWKWGK